MNEIDVERLRSVQLAFERDLRIRPEVRTRQMPPLGTSNSWALELLQSIEGNPVFVDPQRGLQVITRARAPQRLAPRPLCLKKKLPRLELGFQPHDVVLCERVVQPDVTAVYIGGDVEASKGSGSRKADLATRTPGLAVAAIGAAI